jgi:hypothetical protein
MMLFDVLSWAGSLTCFIWDVKHAGRLIAAAKQEAIEIDVQLRAAAEQNPDIANLHPAKYVSNQIHFAACGPNQVLPTVPGMPDDLFTACLTTPLQIALLFHNLQIQTLNQACQYSTRYMQLLWSGMSSTLKQRLQSELKSILQTIAWKALDSKTYQQLFGHKGQVIPNIAAGFMLAQRIFNQYGTTPMSIPAIPAHNAHPLWTSWDLIMENLFEQLPLEEDLHSNKWEMNLHMLSFIKDQLLTTSNSRASDSSTALARLPIILQAIETPQLRLAACTALDHCLRHLDTKLLADAVHGGALKCALSLLTMDDPSLALHTLGIWASLCKHPAATNALAKPVVQAENLTDSIHVTFFLDNLQDAISSTSLTATDVIVKSTLVLCTVIDNVPSRRTPSLLRLLLQIVLDMLQKSSPLVQQWAALLFAAIMPKIHTDRNNAQDLLKLIQQTMLALLDHLDIETRAAMIHGLKYWLQCSETNSIQDLKAQLGLLKLVIPHVATNGAVQVRKELCSMLSSLLLTSPRWRVIAYWVAKCQTAAQEYPDIKPQIISHIQKQCVLLEITPEEHCLLLILVQGVQAIQLYTQDPCQDVASHAVTVLEAIQNSSTCPSLHDLMQGMPESINKRHQTSAHGAANIFKDSKLLLQPRLVTDDQEEQTMTQHKSFSLRHRILLSQM